MILENEILKLPVTEVFDDLSAVLARGKNAVLKAPPGSGKSTALAALFLENDTFHGKKILMLEPRRIACMMVAERIAYLLGEKVGESVGYRMRGEKKLSSSTRLEIVTEGLFTRMIQNDMMLEEYGLIIFDEFHERNIHSDLGLALSLDVKNNLREDLSLLVMSATLNIDELRDFMFDADFFECGGRIFDTEIFFAAEKNDDIVGAAFRQVMRILSETENGNILVFLAGAYEIQKLSLLLEKNVAENVIIAPLYGALSKDLQQKALRKTSPDERKIVVATNIAESSVTIDDIRFVVDSGREKRLFFDSSSGMDKLQNVRIAKSSAIQRAGRAGRTSGGKVYRLYTRFEYESMIDYPVAEIASVDLANFCLELAMWGSCADDLKFLTPPAAGSLVQGQKLLMELEMLDEAGNITAAGKKAVAFPGSCRVGRMFLAAQEHELDSLGCELAALLEERILPDKDICRSLEILRNNPTVSYRHALDMLLKEKHLKYRRHDVEHIGELLFAGFPDRVCKRRKGSLNEYQSAGGRGAFLTETLDDRRGEFIVAPLLDMGDDRAKISAYAVFDGKLLTADKIKEYLESSFDEKSGVFVTEKVTAFHKMVLDRKISNEFDEKAFKKAVLAECRKRSLSAVFALDGEDENFLRRCQFANFCEPDKYSAVSEEILLEDGTFADCLDSSCRSLAALKKVQFKNILKQLIGYEKIFALDSDYPEKYLTPGGSSFKIRYKSQEAVLSVPVSEMYGTSVHPVLGRKKIPLKIELLSPAMRPVQITSDLPAFWRTNWQYVQKEMKQRYIKHFWPDDPVNALPGRSIRKK